MHMLRLHCIGRVLYRQKRNIEKMLYVAMGYLQAFARYGQMKLKLEYQFYASLHCTSLGSLGFGLDAFISKLILF